MLNVQKYLIKHSLLDLEEKFAIKIKRHSEYPNLVLLKYNQLLTPMNDLTRECRGLILDQDQDWNVVCYTYKRFANHGEGWADKVDFSTARVYEKADGSLMQLYYYDNKWNVATSGMPDANGEVNGFDISFRDLFWRTWEGLGYELPTKTEHCIAFELCTKYNRIVVKHEDPKIILHGVRRLSDFKELNPVIEAYSNGWECVRTFPFDSIDDVIKESNNLNGLEQEGFVVCDDKYNRVKIKCKDYVAISRLKDSVCSSKRQLLEKIRINDQDEFLVYFPEMREEYYEIKIKYERLASFIEGFYESVKDIEDRKTFALACKDQKFSGVLFGLKFGKVSSVKEGLADINIKHLEQWLGIKSAE